MLKQGRLLSPLGTAAIDGIVVNLAFWHAWWLRYVYELGPEVPQPYYADLSNFVRLQVGLTIALLLIYTYKGLYNFAAGRSLLDEASIIVGGALLGLASIIVFVFYDRTEYLSRLLFAYVLVLTIGLLLVVRWFERMLLDYLRQKGLGLRRTLIVGAGPLGRMVVQSIVARPDFGYLVVGFVDDDRSDDIARFPFLGPTRDVGAISRRERIDEVIIALPAASHESILRIMRLCERARVSFRLVPDFYELSLDRVHVQDLDGIPLIGIKEAQIRGLNRVLKRGLDLAVVVPLLPVAAVLSLVIAIAIKLDSTGPVLFRQVRVGRGGAPFIAYKFRSMRHGADAELEKLLARNEATGPLFKMRKDPRLTRVGRWLRRTSLDELPQFLNILRGDMSLVGPRPPVPKEVDQYEEWHRRRLNAAPGLTGMWQVSGRSNLTFDEMVLLDLWYIENWSLGLDFKILLRTVPAVLLARGAY
ncbi:MAG: sugar transferase [Chloroflexi bacterium]|nr:sugar transferase [Chloroflexota bacterium]